MVSLEFISPAHALYASELELRYRVLRAPLGMSRDTVRSPLEDDSLHLVAVNAGSVVGCVLFHPLSGKLYAMAVADEQQGKGLGAALVRRLETEACSRRIFQIHLNARATAVPFYRRLGYHTVGEGFLEVGIPHVRMTKSMA
jgi:predicted GNAT family N-acyltransferase